MVKKVSDVEIFNKKAKKLYGSSTKKQKDFLKELREFAREQILTRQLLVTKKEKWRVYYKNKFGYSFFLEKACATDTLDKFMGSLFSGVPHEYVKVPLLLGKHGTPYVTLVYKKRDSCSSYELEFYYEMFGPAMEEEFKTFFTLFKISVDEAQFTHHREEIANIQTKIFMIERYNT